MLLYREEVGRKMDHKRQEISSCQQSKRELENSIHSLKQEKVHTYVLKLVHVLKFWHVLSALDLLVLVCVCVCEEIKICFTMHYI